MRCSECSVHVKPIVALDIDGTLGDYHSHFRKFAENYLGYGLPDHRGFTGRPFEETQERFWQFLGLDLELYRTIKLAYRQGGTKRWMPAYPHASELSKALRFAGAEVWIATTRPFLRLDNIDPDTREWLERNRIEYDHMIHGDEKYHQLSSLVDTQRVVGILEDLPEQYEIAWSLQLNPIVRMNYHNQSFALSGVTAVGDLEEAERVLVNRVRGWLGYDDMPQDTTQIQEAT